ncbi:MAG TPA: dihydrofolate reductase family protein [Candidatus Saccharimonadia bacterium]|nr:dihydrofolate reductase family protein [Candidatus Saccharimonadia bacterium]
MVKVKCSIGVSVDNCVAGHNMTEAHPFGDMPTNLLHRWMFDEPEKHKVELDAILDAGAFIMGRNMFGPTGGDYNETWKGWWGDEPPYHGPVFVLTHTPREPIEMKGGTTFYFVTDGIESALKQARDAAGSKDISIAGGAETVNQFLRAGLLDELWLHVVPVVYGDGKRLFEGMEMTNLKVLDVRSTPIVTHVRYEVKRA